MSVWDDPEKALEKKRFRCGRSAAYAIGGGIGLLFLNMISPNFSVLKAAQVKTLFSILGTWGVVYGLCVFALLLFAKDKALFLNAILVWCVTPCILLYAVLTARSGP